MRGNHEYVDLVVLAVSLMFFAASLAPPAMVAAQAMSWKMTAKQKRGAKTAKTIKCRRCMATQRQAPKDSIVW